MKKVIVFLCLLFFLVSLTALRLNAFTNPEPGESFVYPNPARGDCVHLAFNMAQPGTAKIYMYNESGTLVRDLEESLPQGLQQERFCTCFFASGAYVYRIYLNYDSGDTEKLSGRFAVIR